MLSAKPWKTDALVRLFAGVLISVALLSASSTWVIHLLARSHEHSPGFVLAAIAAFASFVTALVLLQRTWKPETFLRSLATLLLAVYGGFLLLWLASTLHGETEGELVNTASRVLIAVLCFQGAALVMVRRFLREHELSWREAFGFDKRPQHAVLLGLVAGLIAVPAAGGLQIISGLLMEKIGIRLPEQEAVQLLRNSATLTERIVLGITAILLAPLAEEFLFRGILYPAIREAGFPRMALWLTAVLFGAIHVNLAAFIPLTMFAVILTLIYERTENLATSITAHSVFNATNFVMLFLVQNLLPVPIEK